MAVDCKYRKKKREERERKGGGVESRGETRGECIRRDFDVKRGGGEEEDDHEGGAVYKFNEKERNIPENSRQSKRKKTDVRMYCWDFLPGAFNFLSTTCVDRTGHGLYNCL